MYAHERTLLAKLGFADADRREPLHQLACQYLATPDVIQRLIPYFGLDHGPMPQCYHDSHSERTSDLSRRIMSYQAKLEHEISKGDGQYRTTIGFADVVVMLTVEETAVNIKRRDCIPRGRDNSLWTKWLSEEDYTINSIIPCGIEVKITPTTIADVIRQVKLYRSYSGIRDWTVATAYDVFSSDIASLQNENIRHLRLGKRFDEYIASRQTDDVAATVEI